MTREEADYENEIADLYNRLDIAEYDKERLREEVTNLDTKIKALEQEPCEDAISRAQALSDYADWYGYGYKDNTFYKHLKDMPSVKPQESKWIPVSERLPEEHRYTLWCSSSGCVRSDYFNGEFWEDAKKYCYEVTAWMPLPKPYKAESEDK